MDCKEVWTELKEFIEEGIEYMEELKEPKAKRVYEVILDRMRDLENR